MYKIAKKKNDFSFSKRQKYGKGQIYIAGDKNFTRDRYIIKTNFFFALCESRYII